MKEIITIKTLLDYCNIIGKILTQEINDGNHASSFELTYYLLSKIRSNLFSLSLLTNFQESQAAINLIYRSIMTDLMIVIFLLSLDEDDAKMASDYFNQDFMKSMNEVTKLNIELAEHVFKIKDNFDKYQLAYIKYVNKIYGERLVADDHGTLKIKHIGKLTSVPKFNGNIKQIFEYFCASTELNQYKYLYLYYKMLSQTEHFSYLGRNFNFHDNTDKEYIKEYNTMIFVGIDYIRYVLKISKSDYRIKQFYS